MAKAIQLFPEHEALAEQLVESGRYGCVGDVVMDAFELLKNAEAARHARLAEVHAKIEEGLADVEAGQTRDVRDVLAELDAIIASRGQARDAAE